MYAVEQRHDADKAGWTSTDGAQRKDDVVTRTEWRDTFAAASGTQAHGYTPPSRDTASASVDGAAADTRKSRDTTSDSVDGVAADALHFAWNRFNGGDMNSNKQVNTTFFFSFTFVSF